MNIPTARRLELWQHHEFISFCEFELGIDSNDPRLDKSSNEALRKSMQAIAAELPPQFVSFDW